MGQSQMLECANNFQGSFVNNFCVDCNEIDNESHRINNCKNWKSTNRYEKGERVEFLDVYKDDDKSYMTVITAILENWNLKHGKNEMVIGDSDIDQM